MTDKAFREQLSARLKQLAIDYMRSQEPTINTRGAIFEWDTLMANEVMRLMEWSREECTGERWEGPEGLRQLVDRSERPLTLPPDDWRPE
jgi:hypothetical protein